MPLAHHGGEGPLLALVAAGGASTAVSLGLLVARARLQDLVRRLRGR
jgi:hypothetical protein